MTVTDFTQKWTWHMHQEHESGAYFVTEEHRPFQHELPGPTTVYGPIQSRAMAEGLILERRHIVQQIHAKLLEHLTTPRLFPLGALPVNAHHFEAMKELRRVAQADIAKITGLEHLSLRFRQTSD